MRAGLVLGDRAADSFGAARAQPLSWLTHMAHHRAIDSLRRAKTEPDTVSMARDDDHADPDDGLDALPAPGDGSRERLPRSAEAHEVTRCIGVLSPEQQQCLALANHRGHSHAEAAEHLAQPLGPAKSWVRRGLQAMREAVRARQERRVLRAAGEEGVQPRGPVWRAPAHLFNDARRADAGHARRGLAGAGFVARLALVVALNTAPEGGSPTDAPTGPIASLGKA